MADFHVTLYSGPETEDLERARKFLQQTGVQYEEKNVVFNTGARGELIHHTGRADYPSIQVDGHMVVGFIPEKWGHLLKHADVERT